MKFLVDQHLPPALARFLDDAGHPAQHVRNVGLKDADDRAIWSYANAQGMVMVTNDEDFHFLSLMPGSTGRLLWVKIGNCRKPVLLEKFRSELPAIEAAFDAGNRIVELR